MRPLGRRLDLRIVVVFLAMLLVIQAASFVVIQHSIEGNARAQVASDLADGENDLRGLLARNAEHLGDAAHLLAADYGFRSAIASGDSTTLVDALDNQAARIGASVALYTDARRHLIASTMADPRAALALVQQTDRADANGSVQVLDGLPFQLVTVAVEAPSLIGYVSMGFPVPQTVLDNAEKASHLRMTLLWRARQGHWEILPIGDRQSAFDPLAKKLALGHEVKTATLDGDEAGVRIVVLGNNPTHEIGAALLLSIDKAIAPYRQLQLDLLVVTLLGLVVFGVGSMLTAHRITRPIKALSLSAERLGAGDYATPLEVVAGDEVQDLAQAFEAMRLAMQQREAQIRRLAYWDSLTGLPNRAQFIDLAQAQIAIARKANESCTVLLLDLDRFKHVNDVLGHAFGDRLLFQIAERLGTQILRKGDILARLGGDEFAVCMRQADAVEGSLLARRLRQSLDLPATIDDHAVDVSAAIGIASFPGDGSDAELLLRRAETAMYSAKHRHVGIVHYHGDIDVSSEGSLSLLSDLRHAVEHGELRLYLQPKIALHSGVLVGAEALIRWDHPTRGRVMPMDFIPFAEQTGFIRVLSAWVMERCAARHRMLKADGLDLKMSLNLSTRDLLDQDLPAKLERRLAQNGVDPSAFCIEITESAMMEDPQRSLQTLQRLHDMGLRLSIDDFGTGYSSLAYLKRLPVQELKIDQSFVKNMQSDRADLKIVRSTIDLAHNLGLTVVAEGIEDAQTWALLQALRCDEAQGYFVARPMPEADLVAWAAEWTSPHTKLRTEFADLTA